jgi:hypothetical protein
MEQWKSPDAGVTRISNPTTLQRWIDLGWYHNLINQGYIFAFYCGRFKKEICLCSACRSKRADKTLLIQTLQKCKEKI